MLVVRGADSIIDNGRIGKLAQTQSTDTSQLNRENKDTANKLVRGRSIRLLIADRDT